jgi:hypothetical protein
MLFCFNHLKGVSASFRKYFSIRGLGIVMAMLLLQVPVAQAASAGIVVLGDLTRDYQLKPGQTHEAVIELENRDALVKIVRIYQADYKYTANGESFFPAPGTNERSNSGWLTFSPKTLTILPMQKSQVRYLLRAPKDRSKKGTYWSMLMIQEVSEPAAVKTDKPESVSTPPAAPNRYGVQIITHIYNTGKINLEFTSATVESKNSKRFLTVDIENKGTRIARPEMWLEVYTGNGQKAGRFVSEQGTILPGCSVRREIDISSMPKGTYNSLFIADCGHKDVYGLEIKLVLEGEVDTKSLPTIKN